MPVLDRRIELCADLGGTSKRGIAFEERVEEDTRLCLTEMENLRSIIK